MIKKLPELFKTRAKFTKRNPFNLKMKMREKMKTIEELPLEKQESQVRVEGECIIYCSHRYNMQQTINNISYVRYATYDGITGTQILLKCQVPSEIRNSHMKRAPEMSKIFMLRKL